MNKKLLPLGLMLLSLSSVAAEFSVTKTSTPYPISGGARGHSLHRLMSTDYPTGQSMHAARLRAVSWTATSYPQSTDEKAELCLQRQGGTLECEYITPGASGTLPIPDVGAWGYSSHIIIRHSHASGPYPSRPLGSDSVTFHMSY